MKNAGGVGGVSGSHTNLDQPVAPEQLDAFLRYQFFCLMLESTSGMMLNPMKSDVESMKAHVRPEQF